MLMLISTWYVDIIPPLASTTIVLSYILVQFHEKFLARGERGGQEAAEELMLKVRKYLNQFVKNAETVAVMVKAYANLTGLAQACVKNGKLKAGISLNPFVVGFNRRYPLFDFVDVGAGKEEADNKIRGMVSISSLSSRTLLLTSLQTYSISTFRTRNANMLFWPAVTTKVMFRS
jgi:hypothetical protein